MRDDDKKCMPRNCTVEVMECLAPTSFVTGKEKEPVRFIFLPKRLLARRGTLDTLDEKTMLHTFCSRVRDSQSIALSLLLQFIDGVTMKM